MNPHFIENSNPTRMREQQSLGSFLALALASLLFTEYRMSSVHADDGITFFEQKIRPVLVEHCYDCHSGRSATLKGNLLLDSKAGLAKGGDSGKTVIRPGIPEESYLIRVIQHLEERAASQKMA